MLAKILDAATEAALTVAEAAYKIADIIVKLLSSAN